MAKLLLKAELPILVVAGILGQKVAAKLWSQVFGSEIPDTAQQHIRFASLVPAAILEGALYKFSRMGIDRGLRVAASRSEGSWVGEKGEGE